MVEYWKEKRHSLISMIQSIFYAFRNNLDFMDFQVNVDAHAQPNLPVITGKVTVNTIGQDELPTKGNQRISLYVSNVKSKNKIHFICIRLLQCVIRGSKFRNDNFVNISK